MHQPIDDHFLLKYRSLLDAEDMRSTSSSTRATGDPCSSTGIVDSHALEHKLAFLAHNGFEVRLPSWADSLPGPVHRSAGPLRLHGGTCFLP